MNIYVDDLKTALKSYYESGPRSKFIFISSGGVYLENHGGEVNEESEVADPNGSHRLAKVVQAENLVLKVGGVILRLGALYTL